MNKWRHHYPLYVLLFLLFVGTTGLYVSYKQHSNTEPLTVASTQVTLSSSDAISIEHGRGLTHECITCHTMDEGGPARLGPNLFGILGAHHAHMKGYAYSKSLANLADRIWTTEALDKWLQSPTAYAPGTTMAFPGFIDANDRADIIAYLKTLK
ncbi:MAG: hypothetical protein EB059_07195 [Alphaproteobacteria bacterium]|nr:hypothetical protein [Alphaproteobacteria bacterium]